MADRPIIFSGPMVCALLDGRKSQTRRVVRAEVLPLESLSSEMQEDMELRGWEVFGDVMALVPYAVGDRLWCRETWHIDKRSGVIYRADAESLIRWRSPIHMPRWASRITLTVTAVRVERLQDISEADVWAEGVNIFPGPPGYAQAEFASLWSRLHGPGSWAANPWIVAVSFTTELRNIDSPPASGERG